MRWDNLYLAGVGTYLPERVETVDDAIATGRYSAEKKAMNGYHAVRVAGPDETGPVMAAIAGRQAVARSGLSNDEFGLVLHTYNGHQGLDFWAPASYVQQATIGGSAPAWEMRQVCNAFLTGIESAGAYITMRPGATAALITGGDAFRLPYIDRWASHEQNVNGDGAGAVVLSTRGGFARVRATYSFGDPTLEPIARAGRTWSDTPFHDGKPVRFEAVLPDVDMDETVEKITNGVRRSVDTVLREAEAELSDIRFFLHQQLAETIAVYGLYQLLDIDRASTTFDWGKDLGMVGTVDLILGLNHVITEREPKPGDLILLQGSGAGYSWTSIVLEFLDAPDWTD